MNDNIEEEEEEDDEVSKGEPVLREEEEDEYDTAQQQLADKGASEASSVKLNPPAALRKLFPVDMSFSGITTSSSTAEGSDTTNNKTDYKAKALSKLAMMPSLPKKALTKLKSKKDAISQRLEKASSKRSSVQTSSITRGSIAITERSEPKKVVVVGPWMAFLTEDATIFFFLCLAGSLPSTLESWSLIQTLPWTLWVPWMFLLLSLTQVLSSDSFRVLQTKYSLRGKLPWNKTAVTFAAGVEESDRRRAAMMMKQQQQSSHAFLRSMAGRSGAKLSFSEVAATHARKAWTTLKLTKSPGQMLSFQKFADPCRDFRTNNALMQRLLMNSQYGRVQKRDLLEQMAPSGEQGQLLGQFELSPDDVTTLDEFVLVPMLTLRGMDVMLTDGDPENELSTHPFLLKNGLRDVPGFNVNIMTPWANIALYFQLPSWVTGWDSLKEQGSDPDDVKALKRFLTGDDAYRNKRLKFIPSLVEGPMAVKLVAPPTQEIVCSCEYLPLAWAKFDADSVKGHQVAIELAFDCVTYRAIRTMTSLLKRNLKSLSMDVALVISTPDGQTKEEPQVCLGMLRLDRIDLNQCSNFPDRFEFEAIQSGQRADYLRASVITGVNLAKIEALAAEVA